MLPHLSIREQLDGMAKVGDEHDEGYEGKENR
jgi:hypothetical protein